MDNNIKPRIWLSSPHMGGNEKKYIDQAFSENWVAPLGPNVDGFESDLQKFLNVKHAAALSSGTAAIHLALTILGVDTGDEVLCSSFTFSASVNPIVYQKAKPILIDSEKDTWNLDPLLLEQAIKERMKNRIKPKAIILVHLYGMPAKMNEITAIASEYDIPIIEDAAEALGSTYKGKALGSFGDIGILSFNGNKIITTSGGGALISTNKTYVNKARFLATQARDDAPHYQHSQIGYNYRMSNILAGIGRGQMEVLPQRIQKRREIFDYYKDSLKDISVISFCDEMGSHYYSNRWLTCIIINPGKTNGISREDLRLALEKENIDARPLWKPMHLQTVFKDYPSYLNGISEDLFHKGLCLPSGSNLTKNDLDRIVQVIRTTLIPV